MDSKATSAIIAVGIWLAVVQVFCALWIRGEIRDAATSSDELATISAKLDDLRGTHDVPRSYYQGQRQAEQDLLSGPGWRLENGKKVPVPAKVPDAP
jgi:hypothetical protein